MIMVHVGAGVTGVAEHTTPAAVEAEPPTSEQVSIASASWAMTVSCSQGSVR